MMPKSSPRSRKLHATEGRPSLNRASGYLWNDGQPLHLCEGLARLDHVSWAHYQILLYTEGWSRISMDFKMWISSCHATLRHTRRLQESTDVFVILIYLLPFLGHSSLLSRTLST